MVIKTAYSIIQNRKMIKNMGKLKMRKKRTRFLNTKIMSVYPRNIWTKLKTILKILKLQISTWSRVCSNRLPNKCQMNMVDSQENIYLILNMTCKVFLVLEELVVLVKIIMKPWLLAAISDHHIKTLRFKRCLRILPMILILHLVVLAEEAKLMLEKTTNTTKITQKVSVIILKSFFHHFRRKLIQ